MKPLFGYFGAANYRPTEQVAITEIADHCDLGWLGSWACTPETLAAWHIAQMKAGIEAGIKQYILTIDVLCWDPPPGAIEHPQIGDNLTAYFTALREADLLRYVVALYPIDEPTPSHDIEYVADLIREIVSGFAIWPRLAVIYAGLPKKKWWQRWFPFVFPFDAKAGLAGVEWFDWVGADDYDQGTAFLEQCRDTLMQLRPDQQMILVPGGCNPWRQDPLPFIDFAKNNRVALVTPFLWTDAEFAPGSGIRNNGMADAYRAAARSL